MASTSFTHLASSDASQLSEFLSKYDSILFDCDGVLWHGDVLVPQVSEAISLLRRLNKKLLFVTNNATKSRASFLSKFHKLGLTDVKEEEVFGSAYATAVWLKYVYGFPDEGEKREGRDTVYIIGENGIEEEFEKEGIKFKGATDPADKVFLPSMDFSSIQSDPSIGAVVCGFDMSLNYQKLAKAFRYLNDAEKGGKDGARRGGGGCRFILTNDDSTFPANGTLYPGSGALSAPLRYSVKQPPTVVGKPNTPMMDCILAKQHFDPSRTLMIGDRLDTDIEFGIRGGLDTLLVLTGVNGLADITPPDAKTVPKYVLDSFGDVARLVGSEFDVVGPS